MVILRSRLGLDALVSQLAFLFLGVTLAVESSPISIGVLWGLFPFFLCLSIASYADNHNASSSSLASSASSCPSTCDCVSDCPLVNSISSSSRVLKCLQMSLLVLKDIIGGWLEVILGVAFGWGVLAFSKNFGSMLLKRILQCLAVLTFIELMQRTAIIRYCSALKELPPIEVVKQSIVLHLFWNIDPHPTMHI